MPHPSDRPASRKLSTGSVMVGFSWAWPRSPAAKPLHSCSSRRAEPLLHYLKDRVTTLGHVFHSPSHMAVECVCQAWVLGCAPAHLQLLRELTCWASQLLSLSWNLPAVAAEALQLRSSDSLCDSASLVLRNPQFPYL